jgi:catechol 2,3-dioxygenase-like lactoylglutathione lyase family enzyme
VSPRTLDHVALWVADRRSIVEAATRALGMHVIDENERFTLIGADARRGKLTLFQADGDRESAPLKHIALRVNAMPDGAAELDLGQGIHVKLVEAPTDVDYDLDHVALFTRDPAATAAAYVRYGFDDPLGGDGGAPRVEVGGAYVEFHEGDPGAPEQSLVHHLAVLVDSAQEHVEEANDAGIEIADVVDAANTYAVFLWGPDRVKIEYVEHKPTFSLV